MTPTDSSPDDFDLPPWVVLQLPHDSTLVPGTVRDGFLLSEVELQHELLRMTDHLTQALFVEASCAAAAAAAAAAAPVSRMVIDVKRSEDDPSEPMARAVVWPLTKNLGMTPRYRSSRDIPIATAVPSPEWGLLPEEHWLFRGARPEGADRSGRMLARGDA